MHLAIEICIDCNLLESDYQPQAMLFWIPYKILHHVTSEYCHVCLLHLSFSPFKFKDRLDEFCVLNSRPPFTYQDSRTPVKKSKCPFLPADRMWKAQVCYHVPCSPDGPQDIHRCLWNQTVSVTMSGGMLYEGRIL